MLGRIINRSGAGAQPLIVQTNPVPYLPASMDTAQATLVSRDHETMEGVVTGETPIAAADWKFCGGGTFEAPQPLTKLPVQLCLKGGFNPAGREAAFKQSCTGSFVSGCGASIGPRARLPSAARWSLAGDDTFMVS